MQLRSISQLRNLVMDNVLIARCITPRERLVIFTPDLSTNRPLRGCKVSLHDSHVVTDRKCLQLGKIPLEIGVVLAS